MTAPRAPREDHVRSLHGQDVADPYFWMADRQDPRLLENLHAERAYYEQCIAPLGPARERLAALLRERTPPASPSCPWWQHGRRYQLRYEEGAEHPRLVRWKSREEDGEPEVLLDVQEESTGHDYIDLGLAEVSDDGRLLAYSLDTTGDEAYDLRWRDLDTGQDVADVVPGTFLSGAWSADGSVFFYTVLDEAFRSFEVWRHVLGTSADDDVRVLHEEDRHFDVDVRRSQSGDFILLSCASRSTRQELFIPAANPLTMPVAVRERVHGVEDVVEHHRSSPSDPGRWLVITNDIAPEFRLIAADVAGHEEWRELIPGRDDVRLVHCLPFADALVVAARRDATAVLQVCSPDGSLVREVVPQYPAGHVSLGPNHEYDATGVVVEQSSLIHPSEFSWMGFEDGAQSSIMTEYVPGHDPERYVSERISVTSRDGTPIPVTLAYVRGADTSRGLSPGLLYGYGSYEHPIWPRFSPSLPVWLDQGVIYARAHVRGGGEGGRIWWEQGSLDTKLNTFTDYLDVAAALVERGIVATDRLATRGRSAGGMLQGGVLSLDPQRWRAMVAEVPFVDCINTMLDAELPLTISEWEEWGDPRIAEEYGWMRGYTPYENLPDAPLPALLVTGALHDPRVGVHEPAKWVAALRFSRESSSVQGEVADGSQAPLVFRAEAGVGSHGGPSGRFAAQAYEAEVMAFVLDALDALGEVDGASAR